MDTKLAPATATTVVTPTERKANLEVLLTKEHYLESSRLDSVVQAGYLKGDIQILITGISNAAEPSPESRRYMVNVYQPSVGNSNFLVDSSGRVTLSNDNGISPSTQNLDAVIHCLSLNHRAWGEKIEKITKLLTDRLLPELEK